MKNNRFYGLKGKAALAAAVSSVAIMSVTPAYGQGNDESVDESFEEIVVVGKFQQSLVDRIPVAPRELPFSLNVMSRDQLDELNYTRPIDALASLPNINIIADRFGSGTPRFMARGFEAPTLVDNRQQNSFRGGGARDDSFVERYEVLKGPASITLGPISSGGVLNTITKSPQGEDFVAAKLRLDHYGSHALEFDLNSAELFGSEVVSARVSGAVRNYNFDADFADRKNYAIRPVFVFDFSETTFAKISGSYVHQDLNPNRGFPLNSDGSIPEEITTDTFLSFENGEGQVDDKYVEGEIQHNFLDNLKLTVRGSHQETDFDYQNSSGLYKYGAGFQPDDRVGYAYGQRGVTTSKNTFFDAQLGIDFDWNGREQNFVVSAYYNDNTFERAFSPFAASPVDLADIDTPRTGPTLDSDVASPFSSFDAKLFSLLAEAAIRPMDGVTLIAGIRYDDTEQVSTRFRRGTAFESGIEDKTVTFRVGGSAELGENTNVYASYAESFTPQFGNTLAGDPVKPEVSQGLEFGIKGNAIEDRLGYTLAFFRTNRTDVAITRFDPVGGFSYSETIGEVRAQGIELTGNLLVTDGLNINVNYGYTDIDVVDGGDASISNTAFPKHTFSTQASYEVQSGSLEGLKFGGNVRRVGSRESAVVAGVTFDAYTLFDLNASYPVNDNVRVYLNVLNLTDKLYLESSGDITGRVTGFSKLGAPRTVAFTISGKF